MNFIRSVQDMKNPGILIRRCLLPQDCINPASAGLYRQTLNLPYVSTIRIPPGGIRPVRVHNR
jgi:hypothetical protein